MSRFTIRRAVAAAVAGVAALAVSGCGVDAGAAAIVDGRRIAVADVQRATSQVNRIVSQDGQFTQRITLSYLIVEPYLVAEATEKGVGVSEDQARQIFQQFEFTDPESGSTTPDDAAVRLVRAVLAINVLQGRTLSEADTPLPAEEGAAAMEEVVGELKSADIEVNPRYGDFEAVFDVAQQRIFPIVPSEEDWFVGAGERPQPSPAP